MSKYQHIVIPEGDLIQVDSTGKVTTPDKPIICFIEGDGIGPDIWRAAQRIFDATVKHCYGEKRAISWMEIFAGEKANGIYGAYLPEETLDAIREYEVLLHVRGQVAGAGDRVSQRNPAFGRSRYYRTRQ